ncbi:hypothetical protein AVEN_188443-1, partial [Araneus ventricosus]
WSPDTKTQEEPSDDGAKRRNESGDRSQYICNCKMKTE